ncbi:hypothetical protein [Maritimibacter fusiformis]|uniref:Uncharacterized protein n=1 Tax=Maritimibacter fusiformis TaxID=2603819 RepID=A0A5D0RGM8_9RHOB|nr:hypothetical protein [Maritimibacter fusiformis]TYB80770.1 hypothetical protein FVF75_12245 [Maritimibacter fusiformis]
MTAALVNTMFSIHHKFNTDEIGHNQTVSPVRLNDRRCVSATVAAGTMFGQAAGRPPYSFKLVVRLRMPAVTASVLVVGSIPAECF